MAQTQTAKKTVKSEVEEASAYAKEAAGALNKAARAGAGQIAEAGAQARDKVASDAQAAVQSLDSYADDGRRFVRNNPGLSVAAALGVGLLVGMAVKSHR